MIEYQAPLFRFHEDRPLLIEDVCQRAFNHFATDPKFMAMGGIEYILNDAAYQEIARLKRERGSEEEIRSMPWWINVSKRLGTMSEPEKRSVLWSLIESYTHDIVGKFNPKVYHLATQALPIGLSFLFKTQDAKNFSLPRSITDLQVAYNHIRDLSERVEIHGHTETIKELAKRGTLVFVPTHSSNMDSILVGWSLYQAGLPPVTYGAGKNLFTNPLTGFFMKHLGAYKVDRRLQHGLYKEILKLYSQALLERGYHSLFFPGGTRCRSNMVESQLKLGLLGTTITAYIQKLISQHPDPRLYICPVTINYNLALEAESLIQDHLQREGRARYFLENDEFNQISAVIRFAMNTMKMDSTTIIRYGEPMDPFGNRVEADGESYDSHGRHVDPVSYVRAARTGVVTHDIARDRQYTRHTGECIAAAFHRNTVLMPAHIVAYALFELLCKKYPQWDVYKLLRFGTEEVIGWNAYLTSLGRLMNELKRLEQKDVLKLAPFLHQMTTEKLAYSGIETLRMYHMPAMVEQWADGVQLNKLDLLYYYSNRVRSFEAHLAAFHQAAA